MIGQELGPGLDVEHAANLWSIAAVGLAHNHRDELRVVLAARPQHLCHLVEAVAQLFAHLHERVCRSEARRGGEGSNWPQKTKVT